MTSPIPATALDGALAIIGATGAGDEYASPGEYEPLVVRKPRPPTESHVCVICQQVEADEAFLRRALDEIEPDADAVREFKMAEAAE